MSGMQKASTGSAEARAIRSPADEIDPVVSFRDQAIVLSLQGRFVESEACSREALRLQPENIDVINELAGAVRRQGRAQEAEQICRDACRIKPDDFRILTNLGLVPWTSAGTTRPLNGSGRRSESSPTHSTPG